MKLYRVKLRREQFVEYLIEERDVLRAVRIAVERAKNEEESAWETGSIRLEEEREEEVDNGERAGVK